MKSVLRMIILIILSFALINCNDSDNSTNQVQQTQPEKGIAGDGNLLELLEFYQNDCEVPAITSLIFSNNSILEMAAYGEKRTTYQEL